MKKSLIVLIFALIGTITESHANLLISPTRIMFDSKQRVKDIILINTSNKERSYRIEWVENSADNNGNYSPILSENVSFAASDFIRYSPRQVTLLPGEKQTVKLMLRRNNSMNLPEYRSHLRFAALPPKQEQDENEEQGIRFKINVLTSYVVPVLLRTSKAEVNVEIEGVQIVRTSVNSADIKVRFVKRGLFSASGQLTVYLVSPGSGRIKIGELRGINIFHENNELTTNVTWQDFTGPVNGKIEVLYEGSDEYEGITFDETSFNISIDDF